MATLQMHTTKPVAFDSPDHIFPHGTARDNSVNWEFNRKLFELIPAPQIRVMDLGCSGGGFVKSVLDMGGIAVGVEGSDYSKLNRRAEWATIPNNLFTADVTVPFTVGDNLASPMQFNVITAWEFMEHIAEDKLPAVFENIRRHSLPGALVIFSVATDSYIWEGVQYHQTVRPPQWWLDRMTEMGFTYRPEIVEHFGTSWVRGWPAEPSFHLVVTPV